ncbi:MAG: hypothetical protein CSA74_01120 [Rhodobacterales bacterium]|nr:MAG: hypothetical protein CSA74_01120 [Rhodobacterales bacterium]
MGEPDVTLTDFGLAALCFGFTALLLGEGDVQGLFAGLYAALGVAAFTGALSHGWFTDRSGGLGKANWLATMLAIGVANSFLWLIAAQILALVAPLGDVIAWGQLALYAALAIFVTRSFLLSSGFSLPPTLVLTAAFASSGNWLGAAGLAVALLAALLQMRKVSGLGLTFNAFYHVVQALAFVLVFLAIPAVTG